METTQSICSLITALFQSVLHFTPRTSALQFEVDAMDGRGGLWGYQWKIARHGCRGLASARIHGRYLAALHPDDL